MWGTGRRACPLGQAPATPCEEAALLQILSDHFATNAFSCFNIRSLHPRQAYARAYGIEAVAWFESALSLLLESTAVTT